MSFETTDYVFLRRRSMPFEATVSFEVTGHVIFEMTLDAIGGDETCVFETTSSDLEATGHVF